MSSFCRQLAIHIILSDCQTKLYVSFLSRNEELERESSYANLSQFLMSCLLYSISTNRICFLTMAMAHMAQVILKTGCFLTTKTSPYEIISGNFECMYLKDLLFKPIQ